MKKIKFLIATALSFALFNPATARQFRFLDGTIVEGEVYDLGNQKGYGPDNRGIIIGLPIGSAGFPNYRVYMHHYPYRLGTPGFRIVKELIDDGQYTNYRYKRVPTLDRFPTYAPPTWNDLNPPSLPQCVPSRIPFIHFDKKTLRSLAANELAAHNGTWHKAARGAINQALVWKPSHPSHFNTPQKSAHWQNTVEKEYKNYWRFIYYGKWFERRRR